MKKTFASVIACLTSSVVMASTADCQNLYVGRVVVENGQGGLSLVVFLNNQGDTSGSYWVHFESWGMDEKKAALALLTTAKISQHRVNVATTATGGCGIQAGDTVAKNVTLATNP
jgi:hypothetical protein